MRTQAKPDGWGIAPRWDAGERPRSGVRMIRPVQLIPCACPPDAVPVQVNVDEDLDRDPPLCATLDMGRWPEVTSASENILTGMMAGVGFFGLASGPRYSSLPDPWLFFLLDDAAAVYMEVGRCSTCAARSYVLVAGTVRADR